MRHQIKIHWTARLTIRLGTCLALLLLIAGFFFPRQSFYAISLCKSAVYSFAVSVIGGLFLDVVARRTGKHDA